MIMSVQNKGLDETLLIVPETEDEGDIITEYARPGEPLVVVLKKDVAYEYPHLEIRTDKSSIKRS